MAQNNKINITVTDADGNVYQTVKVGNQVWTIENLKTTKYNDGTPIPLVMDSIAWGNLTTPGFCWYNNDMRNKDKYGALYNWYAVDTKKLAPKGWHVATDAEWKTLENYLIANGYNWDGSTTDNKIAKSLAAKTDWAVNTNPGAIGNDLIKNNKSDFSTLPGGYRGSGGNFYGMGGYGHWWSASEINASFAYGRDLRFDYYGLYWYDCNKSYGFSVRLLQE
jgi:uncharacterized protein (TIGR02145 family)